MKRLSGTEPSYDAIQQKKGGFPMTGSPRPALLLVALMAGVMFFCGWLTACRGAVSQTEPPQEPSPESAVEFSVSGSITPKCLADNFQLDDLTEAQLDLLAHISADQLPRETVRLSQHLMGGDIWRDTLIPLADGLDGEVTLYAVVGARDLPQAGEKVALLVQELNCAGIVLRYGDRAAYYPLYMDLWYGTNPELWTGDFNGDGRPEAAVSLFWGRGVGCWVESLYLFVLDTLEYTVPNYSPLEIGVSYDPDGHTARLSAGDQTLTVAVPDHLDPLKQVEVGEQVRFFCTGDWLYCQMGLDFSGIATLYPANAVAPILWDEEEGWRLGPVILTAEALVDRF